MMSISREAKLTLLHQVTYVSEVALPAGQILNNIRSIWSVAQERNRADGITGLLLFSDRFFLQVLEGPREAVTATLKRIFTDERHDKVRLVQSRAISTRQFGDWAMRLVQDRTTWTLPTSHRRFDPLEATAEDLLSLLLRASGQAGADSESAGSN